MNRTSISMASMACRLSLVCALALSPALMAQEDEDVRIVIKKAIDCEGEDCAEGLHQVFIDDSGNAQVLSGEGANVWVGTTGHDEGDFVVHALHGKGGFLGVSLTELSDELRTHFGVSGDGGVMVSKVVDDSAAFRAGLKVGDIVSAVDGETVSSSRALSREISSREDGEQVTLEVWRDGRLQNISATLEKNESAGNFMKMNRQIRIECDDDQEDCDIDLGDLGNLDINLGDMGHKVMMFQAHDFDCGSDDCKIEVQCTNESDCVCTVNGEDTDCEELGH